MYYNLSMHFPLDGLLWLVVVFCYFKNAETNTFEHFQARNWCIPGKRLSLASLDFGKLLTTVFAPTHTPITALNFRPPHLSSTQRCQIHLLADLMVVKLAFLWMLLRLNTVSEDNWPFSFMPDIFLIRRLSSLSWGILREVCLFYDVLKELVSVFVRASYFQLFYRVISFCSYYFCLPPSLYFCCCSLSNFMSWMFSLSTKKEMYNLRVASQVLFVGKCGLQSRRQHLR